MWRDTFPTGLIVCISHSASNFDLCSTKFALFWFSLSDLYLPLPAQPRFDTTFAYRPTLSCWCPSVSKSHLREIDSGLDTTSRVALFDSFQTWDLRIVGWIYLRQLLPHLVAQYFSSSHAYLILPSLLSVLHPKGLIMSGVPGYVLLPSIADAVQRGADSVI